MIEGLILHFLAQAIPSCVQPLGGGAKIVRESGPLESVPFESLGPATSVIQRPKQVQQTASPDTDRDESDNAQCTARPIQIV
jgi:hypothetical protein